MKSPSNRTIVQAALIVAVAVGGGTLMRGQDSWDFDLDVVPPAPAPAIEYVPAYTLPSPLPVSTPPRMASPPSPAAYPSTAGSNYRPTSSAWSIRQGGSKAASRPAAAPPVTSANSRQPATQIGRQPNPGGARTVAHEEDPSQSRLSGFPIPFAKSPPADVSNSYPSLPSDRTAPPSVLGNHLGLRPGETATERSLRLMSAISDLDRQLQDAMQVNANLNHQIQQRDEKLQLAVREIRAARKGVATAKEEVERLRREVDELREKIRSTEKDNTAVLQTIAPLLQQLIESEEVGTLPTKPLD